MKLEHSVDDCKELVLTAVDDPHADLRPDLAMGARAFGNAFKDTNAKDLGLHFGTETVEAFYMRLFQESDVDPFKDGKLVWIRATINSSLVGWMTLKTCHPNDNVVYVSTVVVHPDKQSRGFGKIMLDAVVDRFFPSANEIWLAVRRINHRAIMFYKRNGFEDISSDPAKQDYGHKDKLMPLGKQIRPAGWLA